MRIWNSTSYSVFRMDVIIYIHVLSYCKFRIIDQLSHVFAKTTLWIFLLLFHVSWKNHNYFNVEKYFCKLLHVGNVLEYAATKEENRWLFVVCFGGVEASNYHRCSISSITSCSEISLHFIVTRMINVSKTTLWRVPLASHRNQVHNLTLWSSSHNRFVIILIKVRL